MQNAVIGNKKGFLNEKELRGWGKEKVGVRLFTNKNYKIEFFSSFGSSKRGFERVLPHSAIILYWSKSDTEMTLIQRKLKIKK